MTAAALALPGAGDGAWHVPAGAPFAGTDRAARRHQPGGLVPVRRRDLGPVAAVAAPA